MPSRAQLNPLSPADASILLHALVMLQPSAWLAERRRDRAWRKIASSCGCRAPAEERLPLHPSGLKATATLRRIYRLCRRQAGVWWRRRL